MGSNVLIEMMEEDQRLGLLSDFELILETIKREAPDDPRVLEMMRRIYPHWEDEPEPPMQPRWVSIAIPVDVAHDVVAFSECHCEESVAKNEEETRGELYKPCLYCACRAALYRATRHEMYKPDAST